MKNEMNFIFETDSLDFISPSVFSCCSIVSFEVENVGWHSLCKSFIKDLSKKLLPDQIETIETILEWIIPAILNFMDENAEFILDLTNNYLFRVN